jgi:uncharacterized cupin superfamily protein
MNGVAAAAMPAAAGQAPKRAGLVLATLILVAGVANLNLSVANVALPDIGKAFDAGQTGVDLAAVGYSLGLAASPSSGSAVVFFLFPATTTSWPCSSASTPKTPSRRPERWDNRAMAHRVLRAADAFWRPSNQMRVDNTDLAKQLGAARLGARLWRLAPGQASTLHRHRATEELYVLLEGRGRVRVDDETLTLAPLDSLLVEPDSSRQLFNDTAAPALWLVAGAPQEAANTLEMTAEQLAHLYPRGPKALPPELGGGELGT